ncbi:MAG TPA: AbrB/MazE/SpoVT family DNA-binding domain-containing protein [Thermomicrobiales bacterium]|jgi:bifunctional DNA-binding transcriptional regulator/antitoxin component of YhaV-PrlF toxin-antitoxin module|nr:AbrB/MazE/SpoVT family DNA-binding domain-containing protein [Thermomicrobiales bacterium]
MREIVARVNRNGQVTLPSEVRLRLGLATPGAVAFEFDDVSGGVRLRSATLTLAALKGSVPALPGETADLEAEIADAISTHLEKKHRRF